MSDPNDPLGKLDITISIDELLAGENTALVPDAKKHPILNLRANQAQNISILSVIDQLTKTEEKTASSVGDEFQLYSENLIRSLAADELIATMLHSIDLTRIYCNKTGTDLGERSKEALGLAIEIHGMEKMREYAYLCVQTAKAEHWLDTSPPSLVRLQKLDPKGFFVYLASMLIERKIPQDVIDHRQQTAMTYQAILTGQKVALRKALDDKPIDEIHQANAILENALAFVNPRFIRASKAFPFQNLICFATPLNWDFILTRFNRVLAEIIKRVMPRIRLWTPEQMRNLSFKLDGLKYLRSMHITQWANETEYTRAMLAAHGDFQIEDPDLADWRAKQAIQGRQTKKQSLEASLTRYEMQQRIVGDTSPQLSPFTLSIPQPTVTIKTTSFKKS